MVVQQPHKGGNTTDVGLPIEEELEHRLGAVGTRFRDNVVEVGIMRNCERPGTLWNVSSEHHDFGAGAKYVNGVFSSAHGVVFVASADDVVSAVSFQER